MRNLVAKYAQKSGAGKHRKKGQHDKRDTTMRCASCDVILSDYEASIRSVFSREYVSMCKHCLKTIKNDCIAVGNINLMSDLDYLNGAADEAENGLADDSDPFAADGYNDRYYDR
jgi:hypothetical protein